ncbi:heparinase II/III family protein, partial [Candidatus Poribacteria bacterium]
WLEYSLKGLMTFYPHWGGRDGGWAEGISYGQGYNNVYLGAVEGLRAIGLDLWKRPLQRNVRKFFLYCTVPGAEMRPYGDGSDRGGRNTGLAELMRHHARRFGDPACRWWADQLPLSRTPDPLLALMTEDNVESVPPANLPQAKMFRDVGWAALHSHLAEPDKDTLLLFKSSPYGSVSHSHADQNSFSILKGGKALAIPSGYYGPSYGQPHHAEWTRQTKANNSILVNGDGQIVREAWARGQITDFDDDQQMAYVCGDATEAYGDKMARFVRHILFVRPALFVVLDEIAAPQPSRFHWLLHGLEEMDVDESAGTVVLKHAGKSLEARVCSPGSMSFSQTDAFDTPYNAGIPEDFHKEMPNQWHLTASTDDASRETRICATMLVTADNEDINWEGRDMDGWTGAVASGPGWTAEVWAQLVPGASGPDGFGETVSNGKAKVAGRWASRISGEEQTFVR